MLQNRSVELTTTCDTNVSCVTEMYLQNFINIIQAVVQNVAIYKMCFKIG